MRDRLFNLVVAGLDGDAARAKKNGRADFAAGIDWALGKFEQADSDAKAERERKRIKRRGKRASCVGSGYL